MAEYIDRNAVINAISREMDMQDLYLPVHFLDVLNDVPAADVVPWDWLEKFTEGKRYNYLSDFLIEAKVVFYRELVKEANDDSIN